MSRAVILHLGGNIDRVRTTGWRAGMEDRAAEMIVSGESDPAMVLTMLAEYDVARDRVTFDYRPWDTVTHFTVLMADLQAVQAAFAEAEPDQMVAAFEATFDALPPAGQVFAGAIELHVVTDRFHLRRALWVARIVLWGSGVRVVGHAHYDWEQRDRRDPWVRVVKDVLRALWWRVTGHLVYSRRIKADRWPALQAAAAQVPPVTP